MNIDFLIFFFLLLFVRCDMVGYGLVKMKMCKKISEDERK